MGLAALIISLLAIVISIGVPIFECLSNNKLNRINLLSEYFKEIYGEFLVNKIPMARQYIHYNGKELSGTDQLIEVLRDIRERSLYFKYNDIDFYKLLKEQIQEVEDILVIKTGKMKNDDYASFYNLLDNKLGVIYECISNRHIGNKIEKK